MPRNFFVETCEFVPATCGTNAHETGTQYRVAIGIESSTCQRVLQIQLANADGKIIGTVSPSYPVGSDDFQRVQLVAAKLMNSIKEM